MKNHTTGKLCLIAVLALAPLFTPAAHAGQQKGLVNVMVDDNTVQIPISLAAEVCDLSVNVLAQQFAGTDKTACTIDQETAAEHDLPGYGEPAETKGQRGLVNLDVSGNTIQVPIGIAAQVCGVDANVIAQQLKGVDQVVCSIDQETAAEHRLERFSDKKKGPGNPGQQGLVNVSVSGNTVQVPIAVAAEVCDLSVNVLARQFQGTDKVACEIDQETAAEHGIGG